MRKECLLEVPAQTSPGWSHWPVELQLSNLSTVLQFSSVFADTASVQEFLFRGVCRDGGGERKMWVISNIAGRRKNVGYLRHSRQKEAESTSKERLLLGWGNTHTARHIQKSSAKLELGLSSRAGGLWVFEGSASFSLNKDRDAYSFSVWGKHALLWHWIYGTNPQVGRPSDRRKGLAALHKNSKSRNLAEHSASSDRKQAIKNRKWGHGAKPTPSERLLQQSSTF